MPLRKDDPRPAAVYRWFAYTGQLLYVGCSLDPEKRWAEIQNAEEWPRFAGRRTIEWYETVGEALQAEKDAIRSEGPFFNIVKARKYRAILRWLELPEGTLPCLRGYAGQWLIGVDAIRRWAKRPHHQHDQHDPVLDAAKALLRAVDSGPEAVQALRESQAMFAHVAVAAAWDNDGRAVIERVAAEYREKAAS